MQFPSQYTLENYQDIYNDTENMYSVTMLRAHQISRKQNRNIKDVLIEIYSGIDSKIIMLEMFRQARSIEDLYLHWSVLETIAKDLTLEDLSMLIHLLAREDYNYRTINTAETSMLSDTLLKLWRKIAISIPKLVNKYFEIITAKQTSMQIDFQASFITLTLYNQNVIRKTWSTGISCDFDKDTFLPVEDPTLNDTYSLSMFYSSEQLEIFRAMSVS